MVTRADIQALASKIAAEYRPEKIVLFGSHAHGAPHEDSDVDLLVVLPVEGPRYRLAARIRAGLTAATAIDIVVRSPRDVASAADRGDPIVLDAMESGVVLYSAAA